MNIWLKHKIKRSRLQCFTLLSLCLVLTANISLAADKKVLVLNSNSQIGKYATAEKIFKQMLNGHPITHLDIAKFNQSNKIEEAILKSDPDIIYCIGSKAFSSAYRFSEDYQVIFSSIINWRRLPLKNKIYGIANEIPADTQLTLFKLVFPKIKRIGIVYSHKFNSEWFNATRKLAADLDIEIVGASIAKPKQLTDSLKRIINKVDAIWLISDPMVLSSGNALNSIIKITENHKKPILAYDPVFVKSGATLSVSVDASTIGRQAAAIILDIFDKETIEQQVQSPAGTQIWLNMKKVDQYQLKMNEDALASVNHIVR